MDLDPAVQTINSSRPMYIFQFGSAP
jgi:hypothetical protein